jgi:hypothetical protein
MTHANSETRYEADRDFNNTNVVRFLCYVYDIFLESIVFSLKIFKKKPLLIMGEEYRC